MKEKLTAKEVEHTGPGMYGDGGSPWLRFVAQERRSWLLRYQPGQAPRHGLRPLPAPSHAPKRAKRQSSASYSPMALIRWSSAGRIGRQQRLPRHAQITFAEACDAHIAGALLAPGRHAAMHLLRPLLPTLAELFAEAG